MVIKRETGLRFAVDGFYLSLIGALCIADNCSRALV
jgi:hypothetical protein